MYPFIVWAALAVASVHSAEQCTDKLVGREPSSLELSAVVEAAASVADYQGLVFHQLDDERMIVLAGDLEASELMLNGSQQRFGLHRVEDRPVLILQHCELSQTALSMVAGTAFGEWAGPDFHQARPAVGNEANSLQTRALESEALGGSREIYLVVGAGWDGAAGDPLLVSGDGLAGGPFGAIVEALSELDEMRPMAFASVRFGEGQVDGTSISLRAAEYHQPDQSADDLRRAAYLAHEQFFFEEFIPHVIAELGGEVGQIVSFGISSSASFALEQGLKRPEQIAAVIAASPPVSAVTRSLAAQAEHRPLIRLWCGTLEDIFCNSITQLAEQHDFPLETRPAGHASALWEEAFSASLREMFTTRD